MTKNQNLQWLWITLLIVILDQWTKQLALQYLNMGLPQHVLPFLNFTLMYNPGSAFSFLSTASGWQRWFFMGVGVVASVVILSWLARSHRSEKLLGIALAFILGGTISNLWDRIRIGYVVDFIDAFIKHWHWPVFNIADSAICIGVVLLILSMMRQGD